MRNVRLPSLAHAMEVLDRLRSGPIGRLTTGTAIAQVVGLMASPITARLFSPAASGASAVFLTLLTIPVALASLRFDAAIPVPATREERSELLRLSLCVIPVVALITFAVLFGFRYRIAASMDEPLIVSFVWLAPVIVAALGIAQALNAWATREQLFDWLARLPLRRSAQQIAYQLSLGAATAGASWVLVSGQIVGGASGVASLWRAMREAVLEDWRKPRRFGMLRLASHYRSFPLLNGIGTLLNYAGTAVPLLAVGALHGSEGAGYYRWAQMLVTIPVFAVIGAIGSVYGARAAALMHEDVAALRKERGRLTLKLAALAGAVVAYSLLLPFVVPVLLGTRWSESGILAMYSAPAFALSVLTTPTGSLPLYGRNGLQLGWEAFRALLVIAAFLVARETDTSLRGTTALLSGALGVGYVVHLLLNEWATRRVGSK